MFSNTFAVTQAQINESIERNGEFEKFQTHTVVEQLPDLEIVDVTGSNDLIDAYFRLHIKNVGNAPFSCEEDCPEYQFN